jgi:hypothetical protein
MIRESGKFRVKIAGFRARLKTTRKQTIYILTLTLILLSCSGKTRKLADTKSADLLQTVLTDKKQPDIYIKGKSLYDQTFIDGLSDYNEPIRLIENYIITGKDTTYFPDAFPLNKPIVFKGTKADDNYLLTVTGTNFTNLIYNFKLTGKDDKTLFAKSGKSILGSLFFLASEMDEDIQTGEGYASCEYWDKTKDCWFAIRISYYKDKNGKLRAKLTYGSEDKSGRSLKLEECPTLWTE